VLQDTISFQLVAAQEILKQCSVAAKARGDGLGCRIHVARAKSIEQISYMKRISIKIRNAIAMILVHSAEDIGSRSELSRELVRLRNSILPEKPYRGPAT